MIRPTYSYFHYHKRAVEITEGLVLRFCFSGANIETLTLPFLFPFEAPRHSLHNHSGCTPTISSTISDISNMNWAHSALPYLHRVEHTSSPHPTLLSARNFFLLTFYLLSCSLSSRFTNSQSTVSSSFTPRFSGFTCLTGKQCSRTQSLVVSVSKKCFWEVRCFWVYDP